MSEKQSCLLEVPSSHRNRMDMAAAALLSGKVVSMDKLVDTVHTYTNAVEEVAVAVLHILTVVLQNFQTFSVQWYSSCQTTQQSRVVSSFSC